MDQNDNNDRKCWEPRNESKEQVECCRSSHGDRIENNHFCGFSGTAKNKCIFSPKNLRDFVAQESEHYFQWNIRESSDRRIYTTFPHIKSKHEMDIDGKVHVEEESRQKVAKSTEP